MAKYDEETVRYEVWCRHLADGRETNTTNIGFSEQRLAEAVAAEDRSHEIEAASYEMRAPMREFFVVKATTTRERV